MARVLFFGDRNLTWRHLRVMKLCAQHAVTTSPEDLGTWLETPALWLCPPVDESVTLIHGDGPPGTSTPGAIGADKLSELACMETWPERRRVRRFPPKVKPGATSEEWARAARDRNLAMVQAKPDRIYCLHQSLDSSRGSKMTADMLGNAGLHYWHVRVSSAGAVLAVEWR